MERLSLRRRYLQESLGPGLREDGISLPKSYGHGPFGANFHEVSISHFFNARVIALSFKDFLYKFG